ncbi:MAG: mandelate racemase/muconate lactonizing enzyme family protein [Kofleriaceae bacterium]|nr:mandelate racemase/muconate lactonizing enzyme family protein [Kofleriaceae bacterium]
MKIDNIECARLTVTTPTRGAAVRMAGGTAGWQRDLEYVRVSSGGIFGLGEAAPLSRPGPNQQPPSQLATMLAATAAATIHQTLPLEIEGPGRAYVVANTVAHSAAARFAIETALLDCWCHNHQLSLAQVLVPNPIVELATAAVVGDADDARACVAQGFTTLKLKLTADAAADFAVATAIRTAVGDSIQLRGDANQTWTIAETPKRLRALAHLNWEFIEEPCIDTHKLVPMDLPIMLALDESLPQIAPSQLGALLRARSLWGVVLKPTILGGLLPTLALAELVARGGKQAIVTHALEGPVATAACAEAARAVASLFEQPAAAGLGNNPTLSPIGAHWIGEVTQLTNPGRVRATARHGHGFAAPQWPILLS